MDLTLIIQGKEVIVIDCSDGAEIPEGMGWLKKIKYHRRHGRLMWDGTNLELRHEMHIFVNWNVCVLFWLLANKGKIPNWLKGRYLIFEGTCFLNQDGEGVLLSLFWNKDEEDWSILPYPEEWRKEGKQVKIIRPLKLVCSNDLQQEESRKSFKKRERWLRLVGLDSIEQLV